MFKIIQGLSSVFRAWLIGGTVLLLASAVLAATLVKGRSIAPSGIESDRAAGERTRVTDEGAGDEGLPDAITQRDGSHDRPTPIPFSGAKQKPSRMKAAPPAAPGDEIVALASGLPLTRETFTAHMPPIYWLSLVERELFDCWTEDKTIKDALRIVQMDVPGLLTIEAFLPFQWSIEITDQDKPYESDEHFVTGWFAGNGDEGARLVVPIEAGQRIGISGCNFGSSQTSIDISYEFDPNRGMASPRNSAYGLTHIAPGQLAKLKETVPVNFVFVGFDEASMDIKAFNEKLPKRYQPLARIPNFYGLKHHLGIDYTYRYKSRFTDGAYEDRFFAYLQSIGQTAPLTSYQRNYNLVNPFKRQNIDKNFVIDATAVEKWLGENPPPAIDTTENTIYFINWFGRPDFKFHVFSHLGDPDPDVNKDQGTYDSNKVIAWGGTPPDDPETGIGALKRVWFYDFSAGPDFRTSNGALRNAGVIPPIWEYHPDGARQPQQLSTDLAKLARYVGIDLLFTPSPLYPPAQTPPQLPQSVQIDLGTYEGIPGFDASAAWLKPDKIRQSYQLLLPLQKISVTSSDLDPKAPDFLHCYLGWNVGVGGPSCLSDRPYYDWANLYVHHANSYAALTKETSSGVDYNALGLLYATPDQALSWAYADDNQKDGTQSFMHNFMTYSDNGLYGMTNIMIHEGGHHFGLSHPHDGYDWEEDVDFAAQMSGWTFAWAGDESNTVMNYMDINNDFSQFDRDNMNRWHTASYITAANAIAKKILKSPRAKEAFPDLRHADARVGEAERLFAEHRYLEAASTARGGYLILLSAAERIGSKISGSRNGFSVDSAGQKMHNYSPPEYAYADPLTSFSTFEQIKKIRAQRSRAKG